MDFILVGFGGMLGACLRYALTKLCLYFKLLLPLGTLCANVLAGVGIGVILGLEQQALPLLPKTRLFLATGFLGGFSTFSAFSAETIAMCQSGKYLWAAGNVVLNLGLSLAGVVLGMAIAKVIRHAN